MTTTHPALRRTWLGLAALALAACWVTISPARAADPPELELRFLDVGQGDAVLVRDGGKVALIDTGPSDAIVGKLQRLGVESLDLLLISHNHLDHFGGADAVLTSMPVRHYLDNGYPAKTKLQEIILELVEARGVSYLSASGRRIMLGAAVLHVLAPPEHPMMGDEQNNYSVGVIVERGKFRALLPGDSEVEEIGFWLAKGLVGRVDVLKAAHHASRNGVTPAWIDKTQPALVVISVGVGNPYGHPHPKALSYYEAGGRRVLRTDEGGDVTVWVKPDGAYRVTTSHEHVSATPSGAPAPAEPPAPAAREGTCCRVCKDSKACGDGCVPADKLCTKARGCACNG